MAASSNQDQSTLYKSLITAIENKNVKDLGEILVQYKKLGFKVDEVPLDCVNEYSYINVLTRKLPTNSYEGSEQFITGPNPLLRAIVSGSVEMVKLLLSAGSNPNIINPYDLAKFIYQYQYGPEPYYILEAKLMETSREIMEPLITNGFVPDRVQTIFPTGIHCGSQQGNFIQCFDKIRYYGSFTYDEKEFKEFIDYILKLSQKKRAGEAIGAVEQITQQSLHFKSTLSDYITHEEDAENFSSDRKDDKETPKSPKKS